MQIKTETKCMSSFEMERYYIWARMGGKLKSIRKQKHSGLLVEISTESQSTKIDINYGIRKREQH